MTAYFAAITGDVIASKTLDQDTWMPRLKAILGDVLGPEGRWELFRGDAFQLLLSNPEEALYTAMRIKAEFKSIKGHDLRMAIGIGGVYHLAERVGESNGDALIRAGSIIDRLPEMHTTLAIATPWPEFDEWANPTLAMSAALMDKWLVNYAEAIAIVLKFPDITQTEQAKRLKIKQNTLSERLSRGYRRELLAFEGVFRKRLSEYVKGGIEP